MMQIIFGLLKKITEFKKKILKLSHLFFLNIHVFCYLSCFSLIPECEKCHEKMNLKIILQFKIDNSVFCRFSQFCNIVPKH